MLGSGAPDARVAVSQLGQGDSLGFLAGRTMNKGIAVPVFGRDAMTAPALASLALRSGAPIVPVHVVRREPGRFRMVCEVAPRVRDTANRTADMPAIS